VSALRFFCYSNSLPFNLTPATLPSSWTIPLTHNAFFPPRSNWQPAILGSHKLAGEPKHQPVSLSGSQSIYWPAMLAPRVATLTYKIPKAPRPSLSTVLEKRMGTIRTRPLARSTWPALRKLTPTRWRARHNPMALCSIMYRIRDRIRRRVGVIVLRLLGVILGRLGDGCVVGVRARAGIPKEFR
jgi:hypothetical protein